MRFEKTHSSGTGRYWLGRETTTQRHFLGVPLSNSMIDYIEYYWLTADQYERFAIDRKPPPSSPNPAVAENATTPLLSHQDRIVAARVEPPAQSPKLMQDHCRSGS